MSASTISIRRSVPIIDGRVVIPDSTFMTPPLTSEEALSAINGTNGDSAQILEFGITKKQKFLILNDYDLDSHQILRDAAV